MIVLLIALACVRTTVGRIEEEPVTASLGAAYAVMIPAGGVVRVEPDLLRVDSADGARFFDVRWVDLPADVVLREWGNTLCDTARWDSVAEPAPGVVTVGGDCLIGTRRHWVITSYESHGERALFITYAADSRRVAYEDAWVDAWRTAFTVVGGATPLSTPAPADVRATLRAVVAGGGVGHRPVPGGGELSKNASVAFASAWLARSAAVAPVF